MCMKGGGGGACQNDFRGCGVARRAEGWEGRGGIHKQVCRDPEDTALSHTRMLREASLLGEEVAANRGEAAAGEGEALWAPMFSLPPPPARTWVSASLAGCMSGVWKAPDTATGTALSAPRAVAWR